jgi:hypothetical protein
MKLWHIAQWGNKDEGVNGWDTQCVIRSNDMMLAIEKAELHMSYYDWRYGKADVVYLLGDDGVVGDKTELAIQVWIKPALNLLSHESWHRHYETNEWLDFKTMYGDVE